ncbi:MAG: fumarylacetoacetate hydrolase family protein [Candidatus Dormibacteraceae bacterium]
MFQSAGGPLLGAVREDAVVELREVAPDLLTLIQMGESGLARARSVLSGNLAPSIPLDRVAILCPLPWPIGNVLCVGLNYRKHAEEGTRIRGGEVPPPTIFTKAATSLIGPFDDVVLDPEVTSKLDWEVELGVVVGRSGANISSSAALNHVFGYTVINDVSARDMQHGWGGQWFKGKSLDSTSPLGPVVVTADEIEDPQSLDLCLSVNGAVKQLANTDAMIYPVGALISWLSVGMTVPAGALIATGTPEGVGNAMTPPEYLRVGDLVETAVSGIGVLRNRVVAAKKH